MSYKENCTKGPARFHLGRGANPRFHIQTEAGYQIASTTELSHHAQAKEENAMREANAALIAEAFNVLHEIGMTPAELAEQVAALLRGLEEATRAINANTDTKRRLVKRMQILHNNCQPSKTS